jgi:hypothetical protein
MRSPKGRRTYRAACRANGDIDAGAACANPETDH